MPNDSVQFVDDGERVSLVLRGCWDRDTPTPDAKTILAGVADKKVVTVDTSGVENWDSTLVNVALGLRNLAEQRGLSLQENWPTGIDELLVLAEAVPPVAGDAGATNEARWGILASLDPISASRRVGEELAGLSQFVGALVVSGLKLPTATARVRFRDFLHFCYQTGPNALPIIILTSSLVGLILGYLGAVQLKQFGAEIYVADLVTVGILREMGPLMTAIILAGRTGAAYAAQLGTMRVNEEIDAIEILGVSPMEFLVLPRVAAIIVMTPLLTLFADVFGILGGGLVSSGLGVSPLQYWSEVQLVLHPSHLVIGMVKAVLFGALVGLAGCRAGLSSGRNSEGVGKATTQAVVVAMVYLIIADALVNVVCQLLDI
ncbi:MAG: ABC transporter permease [Luminiphilus sp.]|nr:ABC transporter permease [Luminiphilus sp.]